MRFSSTPIRILRIVAFLASLALLAGACGDDSGDDASPVPGDTPTNPDDGDGDGGDDDGGDGPTDRSDELIGEWTIITYQLAGAAGEAEPVGPNPATISFEADGTMRFSTGCNTGTGEWEAFGAYNADGDDLRSAGQGISFGSMTRTEIGCEGELGDQDLAIPGAIRAAALFSFDGGTLTLSRDGNLMIAATRG